MTYASDLIECAHCGSPITGERKTKMTKSGERDYVYYRCTQYHKGDHPRIRLTENELDSQMLAIFDTLRVEDAEFRDLFREQLRQATNWKFGEVSKEDGNLKNRHTEVVRLQQQLLNLRLLEEIDADTFASTNRDLRDRTAELLLEIEASDRGRNEIIDIAVKAFELSQSLREKWLTADYAAKRRILEIICLNCSLDGVSLVATMRKPFDLLAKGLLQKDSREDAHRFEQMETLATTCVRVLPGNLTHQRQMHRDELLIGVPVACSCSAKQLMRTLRVPRVFAEQILFGSRVQHVPNPVECVHQRNRFFLIQRESQSLQAHVVRVE